VPPKFSKSSWVNSDGMCSNPASISPVCQVLPGNLAPMGGGSSAYSAVAYSAPLYTISSSPPTPHLTGVNYAYYASHHSVMDSHSSGRSSSSMPGTGATNLVCVAPAATNWLDSSSTAISPTTHHSSSVSYQAGYNAPVRQILPASSPPGHQIVPVSNPVSQKVAPVTRGVLNTTTGEVVVPFHEHQVGVMTVVMNMAGRIDIHAAHLVLPKTPAVILPSRRVAKKRNVAHNSPPGCILGTRDEYDVDGIMPKDGKSFEHTVDIFLSVREKNVMLKLLPTGLHAPGMKSEEMALEASSYVLQQLTLAQKYLDYLIQHPQEAREVADWYIAHSRGRNLWEGSQVVDYGRILPAEQDVPAPYLYLVAFYARQTLRYSRHSDLVAKLQWLLQGVQLLQAEEQVLPVAPYSLRSSALLRTPLAQPLAVGVVRVVDVTYAMINYNYHLGFTIDRCRLASVMHNKEGFMATYDPSIMTTVQIEKICLINGQITHTRKGKIRVISFTVKGNGAVTQSGPRHDMCEEYYYHFLDCIWRYYRPGQ
jgi:hypothetical protein